MKTCERIVANLVRKLQTLNSQTDDVFEEIELGVFHCKKALKKLRLKVITENFNSPVVESHFFKVIKPKPLGYLIFYLSLAEFELCRPQTIKKTKKYIEEQIQKYQEYFLEHKAFYQYLERNRKDRDSEYFLRSHGVVKFHPDALQYCVDENFSSSHDLIVAKIYAHKLLIQRLTTELNTLNDAKSNPREEPIPNMQWTRAKSDLIELIYALHETGAINNGNTDIKDLATLFQRTLNIDLGPYYRTYIEIRSRKIKKTKFIDLLKEKLQKKMYDADK